MLNSIKFSFTNFRFLDTTLIKQFGVIEIVKVIIVFLLVGICTKLILRLNNIKTLSTGRGIQNELNNIQALKKRDKRIIKSNKRLRKITEIVNKSPFRISESNREFAQYNIRRAGIQVPGGFRTMTADEFNAISRFIEFVLVVLGILITILINTFFGMVFTICIIVSSETLPMMIIRNIVANKDDEIKEHFPDLYLMIHYVLLRGGNTPLTKVMLSYAKTTDSVEMHKFIDNCVGYINTNGEYNATMDITKDYREIHSVGKLMRLIRQMHEGAEVTQDLLGFRKEIINDKRYNIGKRMDKLVARAQRSFNVLLIVLVQAILSAMSIYLPDLSLINMLMM